MGYKQVLSLESRLDIISYRYNSSRMDVPVDLSPDVHC